MSERYPESRLPADIKQYRGVLLPRLPEGYREPCSNNPDIKPYGAVPANPFLNNHIKTQQNEMREGFDILYKTPPQEMPEPFIDMILDDYIINEERRKMLNYEKYMQWSPHMKKRLRPEERLLVDKFERGWASPEQILWVAEMTPEMDGEDEAISLEVGKVTLPYRYRMEHLEPFRTEVDAAIENHGGTIFSEEEPYRDIEILPHIIFLPDEAGIPRQRLRGFIVKYKRDYGLIHLPNGKETLRVVERQIAAYRVDEESGFDQSVIQSMNDLADKYPGRVRWDHHHNPHLDERLRRTGAKDFIEAAVQTDSLEPYVVPISVTIYAYKEKRDVPRKAGRKLMDVIGKTAHLGRPKKSDG